MNDRQPTRIEDRPVNQIICGNAEEVLRAIPADYCQTCVTSPPYYRLRDYGCEEQIGLETTVEEYIERLIFVFNEIRRVLKPDGTLWLNIGDCYDSRKPKNLALVPQRLAIALQEAGWIVRQEIIWAKPNPMPESAKDRFTNSHEIIFLLSKQPKYYFNHEAALEPAAGFNNAPVAGSAGAFGGDQSRRRKGNRKTFRGGIYTSNKAFANHAEQKPDSAGNKPNETGMRKMRDVWTIATRPKCCRRMKHYARFPEELASRCILAGSREGDIVIDPFSGSGTTCKVADRLGRKYLGIEINREYCALSALDIPGKLF